MECSVIISTHNRSELLKDSLISLANQSISKTDYEILVCDNYSDDGGKASELVCKNLKIVFPELKLYFSKQSEKVGITQTKHELIMKASSEIIVFADDDYIAKPNLLENAIKSFDDKSIAIVSGPLEPKYEVIPPKWLKHLICSTKNGYYITDLSVIDFGEKKFEIEGRFAFWSNMAITKSTYLESPGFAPDGLGGNLFYYNGTGETFYADHIKNERYRIIYNGKMRASQRILPKRFTMNYLRGRYEYYGIGDSFKLFRKNKIYIYFLKVFLTSIKYISKLILNILIFPPPIKFKYLWRLKGLLFHMFFLLIDNNLRNYVSQNNWKEYQFKELKPLQNKNSFW